MQKDQCVELATEIIAAYVSHNRVEVHELPDLIIAVREALGSTGLAPEAASAPPLVTRAQIRKSITPEALISFEDGRPYRLLKRHLTTRGLTPAAYREKWGLPPD